MERKQQKRNKDEANKQTKNKQTKQTNLQSQNYLGREGSHFSLMHNVPVLANGNTHIFSSKDLKKLKSTL